ncbi:MAG: hypothetical protein NVSMB6_30240 [Burkholderiaceae bacterium]
MRANKDVVARYAPGSITSVALADNAIGDVSAQRAQIEAHYSRARQACDSAFFMSHCLDAAHEQHRILLAQLRPIEIEAQAFKRRERVAGRDRELAKKNDANRQADAGATMTQAQSPETSTAGRSSSLPKAGHKAAVPRPLHVPDMTARAHQIRPITPRIDAVTEAGNASSYDRKAAESLERQRKVAQKKIEKARDREKSKTIAGTTSATDAKAGAAPRTP